MTITATTTDPTTRRRPEDLDVATTAPSAAAGEAGRGTKTSAPREHVEPEWNHSRLPDVAHVDISSTFASARSELSKAMPASLALAPSEATKKQLTEDAKAMLPKLEKLEKDLAALSKAMHPYMKDVEEGLEAAHHIKEGLEAMIEGGHMAHHPGVGEKLLGGTAVAIGIATVVHGAKQYAHVIERLPPDAKTTVANAKPILQDVMRDLDDIKHAAKTMADHALQGGLEPRTVRIGA
jgi:hypothetical protein